MIEYGVLDHILLTCKRATDTPITLRHAALALANLSLYSCSEAKKKIIQKKVLLCVRKTQNIQSKKIIDLLIYIYA